MSKFHFSVICFVVGFSFVTAQSTTPSQCQSYADSYCKQHPDQSIIYCTSDGKGWHGMCAYMKAHCDDPNLRMVGHGGNCSAQAAAAHAHCLTTAQNYCNKHIMETKIYCSADGHKYHGLCEYAKASCNNSHITVTGYGENCTMPTHAPVTTRPPPGHFEMSLYDAITHGIDDRLEASKAKGIKPDVAKHIFSKQDHVNKTYVRNKDCWAYGLDLTSISPWNSNLRNKKAGTLVSPRTALWARHYNIKIGSTLRFIDSNNNVVERKVVKSKAVSSPNLHGISGEDIIVGELDSDVPSTISFAKVMPREITTMRVPYNIHIPAMSTDQEEKALVDDFYSYSNTNAGLHVPMTTSIRHDFYEPKIGGDSGNPTFFIIDDELVLLFVFTYGGAGSGTSINHYFDQINEIMKEHGTGHQLTEVDLTKFLEKMPHVIG